MRNICLTLFLLLNLFSLGRGQPQCSLCITFFDNNIEELKCLLWSNPSISTCEELCSQIADHTNSVICKHLCDGLGVESFFNALRLRNCDPTYVCAALGLC